MYNAGRYIVTVRSVKGSGSLVVITWSNIVWDKILKKFNLMSSTDAVYYLVITRIITVHDDDGGGYRIYSLILEHHTPGYYNFN